MDVQLGLFPDEPPPPAPAPVGAVTPPPELVSLAGRLPPGLRLGTSSWTFPGWAGIVYDRQVSQSVLARHGLAAYGAHPLMRTVGLDRTFYRAISEDEYRGYAEAVPEDFRFLVKAERVVTSPTDPGAGAFRGGNPRFLDATYTVEEILGPLASGLGFRRGPVLFQFPPFSPNLVGGRGAFLERLHGFLDALPAGFLYAVELRTPALLTAEYAAVLESTGVAHCYNVHPSMSSLESQLTMLRAYEQPALVIRWMLHGGLRYEAARDRYEPFDRIVDEDPVSLDRIATAVLDTLIAERAAFVVVNNKAEGSSPLSVIRLAERLTRSFPVAAPDAPEDGSGPSP
jgi:uncharacterized protein YecE (DUF72 family)